MLGVYLVLITAWVWAIWVFTGTKRKNGNKREEKCAILPLVVVAGSTN